MFNYMNKLERLKQLRDAHQRAVACDEFEFGVLPVSKVEIEEMVHDLDAFKEELRDVKSTMELTSDEQ